MTRRWYPILISIAAVFAGLALWLPASEPVDKPAPIGDSEPGEGAFGVFFPDRPTPKPQPDTIYAQRIVLRGPQATIILDANPARGQPGVFVVAGDQIAAVYVTNGRPVVGVRSTKMPNAPAVLFADERGNGYLQLREGGGAHVLRPSEIVK